MRAAVMAAAMACLASTGAQASVTYELINPAYNPAAIAAGATGFLAGLDITLSDAAIARGSFTVSESGNVPGAGFLSSTGDLADFVSFDLTGRGFVSPSAVQGSITISFVFAADGAVSSGSLNYLGQSDEVHFSGTGASFGGSFGSDQFNACGNGSCALTGQWASSATTAVPEPFTASLLGCALVGLAAARRRPAV